MIDYSQFQPKVYFTKLDTENGSLYDAMSFINTKDKAIRVSCILLSANIGNQIMEHAKNEALTSDLSPFYQSVVNSIDLVHRIELQAAGRENEFFLGTSLGFPVYAQYGDLRPSDVIPNNSAIVYYNEFPDDGKDPVPSTLQVAE
jgi:hypothetical protein